MIKKVLLLKFSFLISLSTIAQQTAEPVLLTDMLQIQRASQLEISPNKALVLFNVQRIKPKEEGSAAYIYDNQLWLADKSQNYTLRQITYSKDSPSQAIFSPDGKNILFVRAVNAKPQLFLMSLSGGEPEQLTDFKYGASSPKWSPDGKKIIFTAAIPLGEMVQDSSLNADGKLPIWASEKPGFSTNEYLAKPTDKADPNGSLSEIRAYLAQNEKENKAKVINKLQFQSEASTGNDLRFNQLLLLDLSQHAKPKVITTDFNSYSDYYFVNNEEIIVNARLSASVFPDRLLESGILKVNLYTGDRQELYGKEGSSYRIQSVSPSGKFLVYSESAVSTPNVPKVKVVDLTKGAEIGPISLDRNMGNFKWSAKEDFLYFTAQMNGGLPLYRYGIKNAQLHQLSSKDEGVEDYVMDDKSLIYAKTSVANPSELEIANLEMKEPRVITALNTEWLKNKKISFPEKHHFTNEEGMEVEYWVMKPIGFQEGKKYPLLLEIHGGPSAMWGPGESSMWHEFQYFCSKGYGVVYGNPRGSGGYGEQFLRANIGNWGAGPSKDVTEALDRSIAEGWADTSRLLITGGSYAGYLVSWIIGHDQRFKAACSQRGVYDLKTFFGEGNAWRLVPNYFGGYPWEEETRKLIERESPINYVSDMKTPYIIFHGENDLRTGVIQSEMLYKSLKVLGRPVEYVRHPGATHEITRSGDNGQRMDQMLRTYEFFERFIN